MPVESVEVRYLLCFQSMYELSEGQTGASNTARAARDDSS